MFSLLLKELFFIFLFDRPVKFLSNDSHIIATCAEVLKYKVNFNMPENILLKVIVPNRFVQCNNMVFILPTEGIELMCVLLLSKR